LRTFAYVRDMSTLSAELEVAKQVANFLRALTLSSDVELMTVATRRYADEARNVEQLERRAGNEANSQDHETAAEARRA